MLVVLAAAAVLWGLGALAGWSPKGRMVLLALLWAAVVGAHLVLPEGAFLREATGGDAEAWLVLGGAVALVLLYHVGLKALQRKADQRLNALGIFAAVSPAAVGRASLAEGESLAHAEGGMADERVSGRKGGVAQTIAPTTPEGSPSFSEGELERYARHIMLREIGGVGQRRLKRARVLVVGAGGLGAPVILYLAASGIGTLGVIDDDSVDLSNLQRQIIHAVGRIGMPKVFSAAEAVAALNPHVTCKPYHRRLTPESARDVIADYDLVLDGSDNFDTRYLVNRACVALEKPLIQAAITQWEGQLALWHPARGGPCYECVFPERPAPGLAPTCAEVGVAAPLPGVLGAMMAMEAIKLLTGAGESLRGRLMIYDGLFAEVRTLALKARPDCPACGGRGANGPESVQARA